MTEKLDSLDQERLKAQKEQQKKILTLNKLYEDSLEARISMLYQKLEAQVAYAQLPLTHINLVLDMLKKQCVELAFDAYVTRGKEKLKSLEKT